MRSRIYIVMTIIAILAIMLALILLKKDKLTSLEQRFDPLTQSYAFTIPNLQRLAQANALKAFECQTCHKEIYDEWQASTHASALQDIQFQAELAKPDSPKWLCLNCHIPVQNQRESIVTHIKNENVLEPVAEVNPEFDPQFQQEGVSCAACHVRRDEITGESYVIGALGTSSAPHPVKTDKTFLRQTCLRCHDPQGEGITKNLLCWFESVDELAEGRKDLQERTGRTSDCVDCHMPIKRRRLTITYPDLPPRDSHMHHWVGGGVPKSFAGYDSLLQRGFESGLETMVHFSQKIVANDNFEVRVELTNARSGHYLPTGDPERFLLVWARLYDGTGHVLQEEKYHIGQEWLWNPARKVGDNRLKQGETREWNVKLNSPADLTGLQLSVSVLHVRLKSENARYMMKTKGINENYLPNGQELVANAIAHYPFASYVFHEEIHLENGMKRVFGNKELIQLSKQEQGKKLEERGY
ncbi:cytochrome C554 and C-prime [candidate division KSB1 bacterium]|nr:cytochrome C554 and C-prime [candidate division KSB1 bacterium]